MKKKDKRKKTRMWKLERAPIAQKEREASQHITVWVWGMDGILTTDTLLIIWHQKHFLIHVKALYLENQTILTLHFAYPNNCM